eukprot:SM000055S18273  [mRNA]  locus=s55:455319:457450:- [translate_table: standard]
MSAVRLRGSRQLRARLVLATLSGAPLRIDDLRASARAPGLRPAEASLLRLLEKLSRGCRVEINETGTRLLYTPGVLVGGRSLTHDCGTDRAIGYFLEILIVLGLFGKKPLSITLTGITNDNKDPCVDTFRITTLPLLRRLGVATEDVELKVVRRGAPPLGGGEVLLRLPVVSGSLLPVHLVDEGMVKRVRGVAYSTRVSPQMVNRMVDAARGVLNRLLADVYIFTDHYAGSESGKSPGYGMVLVAETTTGCLLSAECAVAARCDKDEEGVKRETVLLPEEVGQRAAHALLDEIHLGGVVDSTHQSLLFLLCALSEDDLSKVRVGRLAPAAIGMLRHIKELLGVQFNIQPEPATGTVLLSCIGSAHRNKSRKLS